MSTKNNIHKKIFKDLFISTRLAKDLPKCQLKEVIIDVSLLGLPLARLNYPFFNVSVIETISDEIKIDYYYPGCDLCGGNHRTAYHQSSNGHKFPGEVRHLARELADNTCALCGKEESFDVHHFLAIWAYKVISEEDGYEDLDQQVLTSIHNALVVCETCHDDLHYLDGLAITNEQSEAERLNFYHWAANMLLNLYHGPGYQRVELT